MKDTVTALMDAVLDIEIMIGSGQIDLHIRQQTGADAYGRDAMAAVSLKNGQRSNHVHKTR